MSISLPHRLVISQVYPNTTSFDAANYMLYPQAQFSHSCRFPEGLTDMSKRLLYFSLAFTLSLAAILLIFGCQQQAADADDAGAGGTADAATATQPPAPPRSFTVIAVGDIMLDRSVWKTIQANGYESILARVRDLTRSADISFANLECPLSDEGPHSPVEHLIFRAPPSTVRVLLDGGFDVVALANNHSLNAGRVGALNTLDTLEKHSIAYCGMRREKERSWEPTYFQVNGYTLGFMSYTDLAFEHGSYAKVGDYDELAQQLASAKSACDFLFVSVHWGNEYQNVPTTRQKKLGHFLVDSGVDVVLGHHPHVLQGVEVYNGSPIFYSMGNFVFDQREGERMESAIFHLTYTEDYGWAIFAKPVWIAHSRMGPVYPEAARAAKIADRLTRLSTDLGTQATQKHSKMWITILQSEQGTPPQVGLNPPDKEYHDE